MKSLDFLLSPLRWWRVKHPAVHLLNWVVPTTLSAMVTTALLWPASKANVFGELGVIHQANGLLQILAGFYIASLAAIATFNKPGLDDIMKADPPKIYRNKQHPADPLTRRRFLCLLFGYLSFASIMLYIVGAAAMIIAPTASAAFTEAQVFVGRGVFVAAFAFFFSHLLAATILGIHYMAIQIQQDEVKTGFES
ncbi:hypothetical protein [Roseomonas chloroacetimidivorans]|uniref:hypothetical protein n=1 Tax=Roseomonas chloroacetimidivorans TaxID=1766656 RepID=UPI003C71A558